MVIYESGEMYLETILILKGKKGNVHASDICKELNFAKSSVSKALAGLKSGGFITVENGSILLTETGLERAKSIFERHNVLKNFLVEMGVSEAVADEDACKMEHYLSDETYNIIKSRLER